MLTFSSQATTCFPRTLFTTSLSCVPEMSRLARTPSGNTYGIVGADRRYRMQAEYA